MPRNGSGTYSPPSNSWSPAVNGVSATTSDFNDLRTDLASALTQSVSSDGQTPMTGNLPMGNNKITGLASATSLTDAVAAGQVQTGVFSYLTGTAGTNTITASLTGLAGYTAGQEFQFISAGANTGATTLNVNSLGAKAITKSGAVALAAGDIPSGALVGVRYDGTQFQLTTLGEGTTGSALRLAATASAARVIVDALVPVFSAYQTGAAQVIPSGVFTKVTLNAEEFDTANCFNTANSRFTPNIAGYYQFTGAIIAVSATSLIVAVYKNGVLAKYGNGLSANATGVTVATPPILMNGTTDYVEMFGFSTSTPTMVTGADGCYFGGLLVRAT